MMYFAADTHFAHSNNLKYSKRIQFCNEHERDIILNGTELEQKQLRISLESTKKHDEFIVAEWNKTVKPDDIVYHLGDICFKKSTEAPFANSFDYYWKQLNGQKILINGNHDWNNGTKWRNHRLVIFIAKLKVNLVHDPAHGNLEYPINLHGHVHNLWKVKVVAHWKNSLFINVGIDKWEYRPVEWSKIQQIYDLYKAGHNVEKLYNKNT